MPNVHLPVLKSAAKRLAITAGVAIGAAALIAGLSTPRANAAAAGPKAYVGLFKDNTVAGIDTGSNKVLSTIPVPTGPHGMVITADGRMVYVASQKSGAAALVQINLVDKSLTASIALDNPPRALNFSPDGKILFFTLANVSSVQVFDPATKKITAQVAVGASPHHPLFTTDGKFGLVVCQTTNELNIIDPATNTVGSVIPVGKMPHWIALSTDNLTA